MPAPGEAPPTTAHAAKSAEAGARSPAQVAGWRLQVGVATLMVGLAALCLRGVAPGFLADLRALRAGRFTGLELWATALAALGLLQLRPRRGVALALCAVAALAQAVAHAQQAATPWLAAVSGATRALAPLLAWCALGRPRTGAILLRLAIAATFAGHGIQALQLDPRFIAFLDAAFDLVGTSVAADTNALLLRAIGGVDLACAALTLTFAPRAVLLFMTFWGFATAAVRIVHGGPSAWPETAIRLVHGLAPWALLCLRRRG